MVTTNYRTSPDRLAERMGVRVRTAPVPPGWWGLYDHRRRLIVLRPGLALIQWRCTLMHELGHAYYGHEGLSGRQERQATRWAARQLLTLDDVVDAARVESRHSALAADLQVLPGTLVAFVEGLDDNERRHVSRSVGMVHEYADMAGWRVD